jgi:hypothetical protein
MDDAPVLLIVTTIMLNDNFWLPAPACVPRGAVHYFYHFLPIILIRPSS